MVALSMTVRAVPILPASAPEIHVIAMEMVQGGGEKVNGCTKFSKADHHK